MEDRELCLVEVGARGQPGVSHSRLLGFLLLIHRHQLQNTSTVLVRSSLMSVASFGDRRDISVWDSDHIGGREV